MRILAWKFQLPKLGMMPMSVIREEHLLMEDGVGCLTVIDTKLQSQSRSGSGDETGSCEVGTRSNRFAEQDGESVPSL
ncbi:hypothetical protein [Oceanobacillus jeddahense]|uniref:Uncharacterized protein n=1 Tax=Oceanobacillus jeddahense TaxID=1462527 RepID=A0ABY5JXA1_9BACI|nr:hypothetical protein [Oceanobacillus jeddahense]UUI03656.1 hypothetical protein NP439_02870 [Oceanobacillus jeddahense]